MQAVALEPDPELPQPRELSDDLIIEVVLPEALPHDWSAIPAPFKPGDTAGAHTASSTDKNEDT